MGLSDLLLPRPVRFRYAIQPWPHPDHAGVMVALRRVDGDPNGGPRFERTSPIGVDIDTMVTDLRMILLQLRAADEPPAGAPIVPREWYWDGDVFVEAVHCRYAGRIINHRD